MKRPKMSRTVLRLFAMALALAMTLCGCADPAAPPTDALRKPEVSYTAGKYDMVPFEEMEYRQPDMAVLEELFTATADYAKRATSKNRHTLTSLLELCWDAYDEFYTMESLAMLRSDIDQSDEDWASAYEFCQTNEVKLEQWLDQVLIACAASDAPVSSRLLAGYDESESEPYSDRALELMDREKGLLRDYWRSMMLDEIEVNGRLVSYNDFIADPLISEADYHAANLAYYRSCNEAAAPIYIELTKVRRALARELGFDSYEDYQYASFARDYTPAQVHAYLDGVADEVSAYYRELMASDPYSLVSYDTLSPQRLLELLEEATADMGKTVKRAFAFMKDYRLYDVSATPDKAPGAYTIYLDSYDAPFCFVGAYGDVEDFLDLAHEFGHFADARCNHNATTSLDLAETYSQAMANLALLRSRELLDEDSYHNLLLLHLLSNLSIYAEQTAYAEFESQVYALDDEDLTVENLNALALSCARRFGAVASVDDEALCAIYWTQVTHLFETPFYVISYCVSADAAVQIVEKELAEPGAGVACYENILDWHEDAFLSEVERVGLVSPFAPGRAAHNLELVGAIIENSLGDLLNAA